MQTAKHSLQSVDLRLVGMKTPENEKYFGIESIERSGTKICNIYNKLFTITQNA